VEDVDPATPLRRFKAGKEDCKAYVGYASTTFTTSDGDMVGKASAEYVRFEYDTEYEDLPGSDYWTASGTVIGLRRTSGNCTISAREISGLKREAAFTLPTDPEAISLYYAAAAHLRTTLPIRPR